MRGSRRYYCFGDGAIWRIPASVIRCATTYEEIIDGSRELAVHRNMRTNRWPVSKLPGGLYAYDGEVRVFSSSKDVECCSIYGDLEGMVLHWKEEMEERR